MALSVPPEHRLRDTHCEFVDLSSCGNLNLAQRPSSSSSGKANANKTTNLGAIIGGTIGAVTVTLAIFALLFWNCRKRKSLVQKGIKKPLDPGSSPFEVNDSLEAQNTLVSPFQELYEPPPISEQKIRPPAPPITPRYSNSIANRSTPSPQHVEVILNQPDPITYRHQDSGWRDPIEFDGRNQMDQGREVIELPPNYSEV